VSWHPPRARPKPLHDDKPFWLISLVQTLMIAIVAYVVALFLWLVLIRISNLPKGPLWTPEFHAPFLFIITLAVVVLLSIPYWMKEWDPSLRTFSMFSTALLIAMGVFTMTGQFDPNLPLVYVTSHVLRPLAHKLGLHM
jgi:hypothetical protein